MLVTLLTLILLGFVYVEFTLPHALSILVTLLTLILLGFVYVEFTLPHELSINHSTFLNNSMVNKAKLGK